MRGVSPCSRLCRLIPTSTTECHCFHFVASRPETLLVYEETIKPFWDKLEKLSAILKANGRSPDGDTHRDTMWYSLAKAGPCGDLMSESGKWIRSCFPSPQGINSLNQSISTAGEGPPMEGACLHYTACPSPLAPILAHDDALAHIMPWHLWGRPPQCRPQ